LVRELKAAYQACCSYVDYSIGQVLGALKENGLEENTVVVLWSDHGSMVGAHGSWGKNCLWEEACRVPLVVAAPWIGENAGKRCSRFVELVDMYPTLADLCGLPAPEKAEGLSMAPLLRDPGRTWKKAAFTTVRDEDRNYTGRGLRTEKWRYAEYNGPAEAELYDRIADPGESANLAGEKEYASVVAELSRLLEQGWRAALPESK
jgi:uncharacterized sulfatase